jgi:hypothetical protein
MRQFTLLLIAPLSAISFGQIKPVESYIGLYLQGSKIGYSSSVERPDTLNGKAVTRTDSLTLMDAELIGTSIKLRVDSKTWQGPTGGPQRMTFRLASGGLTQDVVANFREKDVVIDVDNIGKKTRTVLKKPLGGDIVDDPMPLVASGKLKAGKSQKFWILDPMTVSFIQNEVRVGGTTKIETANGTVNATLVEILDPRSSTKVYLSPKGDFIKAVSGIGIEMRPVTKAEALAKNGEGAVTPDLAEATRIVPVGLIPDARFVKSVKLEIKGRDLNGIPNDAHQSVTGVGETWTVAIHPVVMNRTRPLSQLAITDDTWLQPSLHIPADSPRFKALAKRLVAKSKTIGEAADAIHNYVHARMRPNAGMGVLRNANQVLDSQEGVCRDYAILTATLFRAAGIPARLAGGMIYADDAFFYHAWTEIWDGSQWVGVDTTLPERQMSASHLKLADGNVDAAFAFTFLERATITVTEVKR